MRDNDDATLVLQVWLICVLLFALAVVSITTHPEWFAPISETATAQ